VSPSVPMPAMPSKKSRLSISFETDLHLSKNSTRVSNPANPLLSGHVIGLGLGRNSNIIASANDTTCECGGENIFNAPANATGPNFDPQDPSGDRSPTIRGISGVDQRITSCCLLSCSSTTYASLDIGRQASRVTWSSSTRFHLILTGSSR
jgi:hypothetical protein